MKTTDLYVSLTGNDTWSGKLMKANEEGTDGPLATLQGALKTVREQRAKEKNGCALLHLDGRRLL
jgi:hypothetical protein